MKHFLISLIIPVFLAGCANDSVTPETMLTFDRLSSTSGFCLWVSDTNYLDRTMIDYYDLSTHIIYLKENYKLDFPDWEDPYRFSIFRVFADGEEIYQGKFQPGISSTLVSGPHIEFMPRFYPEYVININFLNFYDSLGNPTPDLRADPKIIRALSRYRQLHEGLSVKIDEVVPLDNHSVFVRITVSNPDTFNYYILSPDKMGLELFHYYTNGLFLQSLNNPEVSLQPGIEHNTPDPWDSWSVDWLDILYSGESKSYSWTYPAYDPVPPGTYSAIFGFPGLHRVDKDDLSQDNGRIWLGGVNAEKRIEIQ